ncbi:MAG: SdiA-regulated domain-containing protein [Chitinophagaceae bacterium]
MPGCKIISLAFIFFLVIAGCKSPDKLKQLLQGYDLDKPEKFFMPESLHEISGISFHNNKSDTIYAIQDEEGKLFRLAWNQKKQYHTKFARSGDYEDLAIVREKVFILKSNGSLFGFPIKDATYVELDSVPEWKHLLPPGEYEGLYGDETTGNLYALCKNCPVDKNNETVTGYVLKTGDSIYRAESFVIDMHEIELFTGKVKSGFRPSALAKNLLTNDWYIISAVNQMLVVTDSTWKIKEVCKLNAGKFSQPEGIAFDSLGNLYISNEGDDFSEGNILKFVRKTK